MARRIGSLVKGLLPRTLFGRSVLILVVPLILVQAVVAWVFYDRLWDFVLRRLAGSVAGEIATTIETRRLLPEPSSRAMLYVIAGRGTELGYSFQAGATLPPPDPSPATTIERQLEAALEDRITEPFRVDDQSPRPVVEVEVALPDGVLTIRVPRSRLFSTSGLIVILWMVGTAIVTFSLATLFLRNQVRSLRRLAVAAEAFGKGRDVPHFKPEGATEVRQAAAAFLIMRERIQRQIAQRTEMLAGVSHDLRTPLTRMKLELELLQESEEVEGLRTDIAEMERMVEGYLSFARGEGNEPPAVFDLAELLAEEVAKTRRNNTQISLSTAEELFVAARRDTLRRAIANLIANAARYGGHVWVTALPNQAAVDILIDDDGPGIPPALRDVVFRPFHRLESSRNPATGGVGLGLTIARDIMRGHGGDLTLESSPQGGLRARLHLPR
jgi:two-component system osmolarity sensor histidine kinase EnvZ